jgi:hypothetical protein
MASGSFNIHTFSWERQLPLSTNTTQYSTLTTFATGSDGFMKPYSFYQYTTASGFPDTSTFSVSITSYIETSLISTTVALGKSYVSTVPTEHRSYSLPATGGYPKVVVGSNVDLGSKLSELINSQAYTVYVDHQASVWHGSSDPFLWVSTIGVFGFRVNNLYGRTVTTRVGSSNYTQVYNKFMFSPQVFGQQTQIPAFSSNFHLEFVFQKPAGSSSTTSPAVNIFVPGDNNYTFTLMPVTSTIIN